MGTIDRTKRDKVMARIVILGGGLTGISAAYHLEQAGIFDYGLYEAENELGGLCRSVHQDGFTFDYTGHLLHVNDPYFQELIGSLVNIDEFFYRVHRRSFVYSHGVYTHYPFQINLHGLPAEVIAECIEGYLQRNQRNKNPRTFRQWVLHHFGPGLAKHFFEPFQQKLFAYDLDQITPSWTGRFVPSTSLKEMILGAVQAKKEAVGYNSSFLYPKNGGIISWVNLLIQRLQKPVNLGHKAIAVDLTNKKIRFQNGQETQFEQLISTIPLPNLIGALHEKPTTHFARARTHLLANSVLNCNIGLARNDLSDKHWIYFPEQQFPFYRIGFPHNFTHTATPPNMSSFYVECSFLASQKPDISALLAQARTQAKQVLNYNDADIVTERIITIPYAYVLYTHWRERYLPTLLTELQQHQIISTGRYGGWKYSSMQEAILDGKEAASKMLTQPSKIVTSGASACV